MRMSDQVILTWHITVFWHVSVNTQSAVDADRANKEHMFCCVFFITGHKIGANVNRNGNISSLYVPKLSVFIDRKASSIFSFN